MLDPEKTDPEKTDPEKMAGPDRELLVSVLSDEVDALVLAQLG